MHRKIPVPVVIHYEKVYCIYYILPGISISFRSFCLSLSYFPCSGHTENLPPCTVALSTAAWVPDLVNGNLSCCCQNCFRVFWKYKLWGLDGKPCLRGNVAPMLKWSLQWTKSQRRNRRTRRKKRKSDNQPQSHLQSKSRTMPFSSTVLWQLLSQDSHIVFSELWLYSESALLLLFLEQPLRRYTHRVRLFCYWWGESYRFLSDSPTKNALLPWLHSMSKPNNNPEPVPEVEMYLRLLILHHLLSSEDTRENFELSKWYCTEDATVESS